MHLTILRVPVVLGHFLPLYQPVRVTVNTHVVGESKTRLTDRGGMTHDDALPEHIVVNLGEGISIDAERDTSAFSPDYIEARQLDDELIVTRVGPPQCVFSGVVVRGTTTTGRAVVTLCGELHVSLRSDDGDEVVEVAYDEAAGHFVAANVSTEPLGDHVAFEADAVLVNESSTRRELDEIPCYDDLYWRDEVNENIGCAEVRADPDVLCTQYLGAREACAVTCDICTQLAVTKRAAIVVFNDYARFQQKGENTEDHTATIWKHVYDFYRYTSRSFLGPDSGLYEAGAFDADFRPVLAAQITWSEGNPDALVYEGGTSLDYSQLLTSFLYYLNDAQRSALQKIIGEEVDDAQLFSGENFAGSVVGVAYLSAICRFFGVGVNQITTSNTVNAARIVAHELGHNLGMNHDSSGLWVMRGFLSSNHFLFSPASKADALSYFSQSNTDCLDDMGPCDDLSWIAYYDLDNGVARDTTGHNLNCVVNGAAPTTDRLGNPDGALLFDGFSNIECAGAAVGGANPRTYCAWARADHSSSEPWYSLFQTGDSDPTECTKFELRFKDADGRMYTVGSPGRNPICNKQFRARSEKISDPSNWHFLCLGYDGADVTVHADGELKATFTPPQPLATGPHQDLVIGHFDDGVPTRDFLGWVGAIDEVMLFSKALSTTEIHDLYQLTASGEQPFTGTIPHLCA
ncbi:hypothetical protein CTAYLR_004525 [Chrysophaeum taylorii]|uniref:Peptidase M12B domain-containing protein n=1 Tax=Chrysophaeum taylorii TaxID=2483200 RepID=A0AAD7UND7_9STRA|nr:hypothetical protein CTAYLR_004525 [Chrysophaeum taylorii]